MISLANTTYMPENKEQSRLSRWAHKSRENIPVPCALQGAQQENFHFPPS